MKTKLTNLMLMTAVLCLCGYAYADDWAMWGHSTSRNMASEDAQGLPTSWKAGEFKDNSDHIDMATTENVQWVAKMGSQTYGNPTAAAGKVFVGTNNDGNPDPRFKGDFSVLKCIDAANGQTLWQLTVPKMGDGKVGDWEYLGICSSPAIDGDRVYVLTNRCEVLCLDINGMANGNQGFQDEGQHMAYNGKNPLPPMEVKPTDADILWIFDMREELNVFPHNITSSSPLVIGDKVWCATSNGVDWSHTNIPSPKAPTLICLDKMTGKLLGEEASGISSRILHGCWSSPAYGKLGGKDMIVFSGPDGYMYGFNATPIKDPDDPDFNILKEEFRCDGDPKWYRYKRDGSVYTKDSKGKLEKIKYVKPEGPSEFIASPVIYEGKIYANIGQDPEHGEGIGNFLCIDPTKSGDVSPQLVDEKETTVTDNPNHAVIWNFDKINRSLCTPAIHDGLIYTGDFSGFVYCLDAKTGELVWKHDTLSHIWGSPMYADGKVYIGNEDGDMLIFAAGREKKLINTVTFPDPIYSTPITANNTIYVATTTQLYAIKSKAGAE
ncbi:MAG: PQQ-binding-like beta-propeller repeat protein [Phycisphaera sp.]|nr:PQQ-binding-like beta-propeller repeat protein [Phycisphaera sp.]